MARLDERLATSPIRDGFVARTHYTDACAGLWLEGQLVHMEDLVLHDAGMDVRSPTHELTRAHTVLRTRRRIANATPEWALSAAGLAALHDRDGEDGRGNRKGGASVDLAEGADDNRDEANLDALRDVPQTDDRLAAVVAAVDAVIAKADRTLARESRLQPERDPLVYDRDWDEHERMDAWCGVVDQTRTLPATLAAAIAAEAWIAIEPLQHMPWLGRLLAASVLRARAKSRWHLPCLHDGLKAIPRERRRPRDAAARLAVQLDAITAAAAAGLKHHDRWLMAAPCSPENSPAAAPTQNCPRCSTTCCPGRSRPPA